MELTEAVRRRRMVRGFAATLLDPAVVEGLLADALRAPTAGHTGGTSWLALEGAEQTGAYWEHATTAQWRASSGRWPGLSRAPVVALSLTSPRAYVERYGEGDKSSSGLGPPATGGGGESAWPVPYWFGDAAFATMTLLLGAVDRGLGACFLGCFRGEAALLGALGVPEDWRLFGAVLLGHPDGSDYPSASLDRVHAPRVHRGRW